MARPPGASAEGAAIRVVLADDRAVMRLGLRALLDREPDIAVAADHPPAMREADTDQPHVLVLDLVRNDRNTVAEVSRRRVTAPHTPIVVLTSEREAGSAASLMRAGAAAFVAKETAEGDLPVAVRAAANGRRFVSANIEARLGRDAPSRIPNALTPRETEVLRLLAFGHTSVEIAQKLKLSPRTVETHRARIHKKLMLTTRAELVRYALGRGLLAR